MPRTFLPDVNVWLALAFEAHAHHPSAKNWFEAIPEETCNFCRLTQQGFLRLATNPSVFHQDALTLAEAWAVYDRLRADPRVRYAEEPAGIESRWRALSRRDSYSPQVWSDAFLAAFSSRGGFELVTFDQAFSQYGLSGCNVLV